MKKVNTSKIIAIVGMCGSGKSAACDVLREKGWYYIRFGQITIDKLLAEGKTITPENEKEMREGLRRKYGMAAFALLSIDRIREALDQGNVVIDGLYSWSEYKVLKEQFGNELAVVAIYAPPDVRYARLAARIHEAADTDNRNRLLTTEQARARDYAEIENIEKGGPIAMADYTIVNTSSPASLEKAILDLYVRDIKS